MKLCPRHSLAILAFSAALVIGSGTMGAEAPAEPKCTGDAVNPTVCWIFRATMAWRPAYSMGALPKLGIAAESIDQHTDRRRAIASAGPESLVSPSSLLQDAAKLAAIRNRGTNATGRLLRIPEA